MLLAAIILMLTIGGSMADPSGGFSEIHGKTLFAGGVKTGNATLETSKKFLKVNAQAPTGLLDQRTDFTFTAGECKVDGAVDKLDTLLFDFGRGQVLSLPATVRVHDTNVTFTGLNQAIFTYNCIPDFKQNPTGQSKYTINVGVDLEQPIPALQLEYEAILERPLTTTTQVTTAITTAANLTSEVADKAGIIGGSVVGAVFLIAVSIAFGIFAYCKWKKTKSKRKAVEHPIKPAVKHKAPKPDPVKVEKPEPPTPEPPKIEQPKDTLVLASNVVPKQPVESKEPETPKGSADRQPQMFVPSKDLVTKPASYEAVANLNDVGPPPNTELTPQPQPPAKTDHTAKSDDSVPTARGGPPVGKKEEPVDGTQEVEEKKSVEMFP